MSSRCNLQGLLCGGGTIAWFSLALLLAAYPAFAQAPQPSAAQYPERTSAAGAPTNACSAAQQTDQQLSASIGGRIIDSQGTGVAGASVTLTRENRPESQVVTTDDAGQFFFAAVSPGPFQLKISSAGFAEQLVSGNLLPGASCVVPQITLPVATNVTEVRVELSPIELAQEQIQDQEKQRVLGVIPNFYVSYVPDAQPLTPKQKFQLAWKETLDPVSFGLTGVVAGAQQATDTFEGYGQGAQGYAKRYGAAYADLVTGTFIGGAILPSLLKQDPRYFYKGTGSARSRFFYAVANAVICKGDNGHWQANYSGILGSLAAGGLSNIYYPSTDRNSAAITFENTLFGIGESAAMNLLQEFVIRKFTSNVPATEPTTP